jgi:quercetin dioxygenase-like cupin family protein
MTLLLVQNLKVVIGLGVLVVGGCTTRQPETPTAGQTSSGPITQDRRFSGSVQIQTPSGPNPVRVEVTNVDIRGEHSIDRLELPFEGSLMVYLQAGEVTTVIGGKREERHQGQIWTVPPGVAMGLTTGRDAASLQTVLVEK